MAIDRLKPKRGMFDFIRDSRVAEALHEKPSVLTILPHKDNPVDNFFTSHFLGNGIHVNPKKLMNWWVIGNHHGKRVSGRIKDIYLSRDLLVREKDQSLHVIPFEHVKFLQPNPA